jgi:hypothetical protein
MSCLAAGALAVVVAGLLCAPAIADASPPPRSALVVFVTPPLSEGSNSRAAISDRALTELAAVPEFSLGLLSATQGAYTPEQMLLDITQGTRTSRSVYRPHDAPPVALASGAGGGRAIVPWQPILRRGASAPQTIEPGLLASSIPGGAAYAGVNGDISPDVLAAADQRGDIATVSIASPATLRRRVAALERRHRYVVADLPSGAAGQSDLRELAARRFPGELLIAIERAPASTDSLLWFAIAGLEPGRELTSKTTNLPGFAAAIDVGPTILRWLGLRVPKPMLGRAISTGGALHTAALDSFRKRLTVIAGRRFPALEGVVLVWLILLLGAGAIRGAARTRAAVLRIGGLALLWAPVAALLGAIAQPSRLGEQALLAGTCFALGAVTDRLLPWPRGPLLPAAVGFAAITADAAAGTHLLVRSLLGPNPSFGARFYGIGNELKSGLAVLVLVGVAAALTPARRAYRNAAIMAAAGVVLGVVIGSARLGAGVGGVVLVAAATAVATLMLLPGGLTRLRLALALATPVAALVALAALDLATAGGRGHYTHDVIQVHSAANLHDVIVRRYALAWEQLKRKDLLTATVVGLLAVAYAVRNRRLFAVLPDPAWRAALLGGLTAGVVGALTEDSGPMLFIVAVFVLACVTAYIRGAPATAPPASTRDQRADATAAPVG